MGDTSKLIGIIGGMGPEAGHMLHQYVNQTARDLLKTSKDSDYPHVVHLSLPALIPDRTDFLLGLSEENPAEATISIAKVLSLVGKELNKKVVACVACNAFHSPPIWQPFKKGIQGLDNLEFIHLVDTTVEMIREIVTPPAKIAIFATMGLNKEKLYEAKLSPLGYEIVPLTPHQQQQIHKAIYDRVYGLKANSYATKNACNLIQGVVQLLKQQDIDRIVFGCTELSIAYPAGSDPIFVDPMMIMAKKLIRFSQG